MKQHGNTHQTLIRDFILGWGFAFSAVTGAQTAPPTLTAPSSTSATEADQPVARSNLDANLFYKITVAELAALDGAASEAFRIYWEAARSNPQDLLFERAARLALDARDGHLARQVASEWASKLPDSAQANNYLFQILFGLEQYASALEPLREYLRLAPDAARPGVILGLNTYFSRIKEKAAALTELERLLKPYASSPSLATSSAARLTLARAQIDQSQYNNALVQLKLLTAQDPASLDGWLLLGALQLQENQFAQSESSLLKFLEQAQKINLPSSNATYAQAYLNLAQLAENRKDFEAAQNWLSKIEDVKERLAAQVRRASILAKQGKLPEARALIQQLPEPTQQQARAKLLAEAHLLRDHKQVPAAIALLEKASAAEPQDTDWMYELSTLHEKAREYDKMEVLLRRIIALRPANQIAYNALGYSLADRGVRLPEAKQLIEKALEITPNDPYITDSLGWVEFRMGRYADALKTLQGAYKTRADAEIGAHIGEVLWKMNRQEEAKKIWREAQTFNADNETLIETLKRLGVKL